MVQTTPVYGWPYPELGDSPTVPAHMQALAEAVESTLQGNLTLGGNLTVPGTLTVTGFAHATFSPNVYTGGGASTVSRTVNSARYWRLGNLVIAQADVTVNANTSGGVAIDLPLPSAVRLPNCGTCALTGSGTPADQSGIAFMTADSAKLVVIAYSTGFRDATSGQGLRYSVMYPAA
jgi:hypothetical protein